LESNGRDGALGRPLTPRARQSCLGNSDVTAIERSIRLLFL